MSKIYRDDDISAWTDLATIMRIQELFVKYNKVHTITIVMENLWESRGVWEWVTTTPNLDIALHGWKHRDYSLGTEFEIYEELKHCIDYWNINLSRLGKYIPLKVFYPPWNKCSDVTKKACTDLGLELNDCVDTSKVYNFHWWENIGGKNLKKLEQELSK